MGFTYPEVDRLLVRIVDRRATDAQLLEEGFQQDFIDLIRAKISGSQYKRRPPLIAKVGMRTIGTDFLYHRDWGR